MPSPTTDRLQGIYTSIAIKPACRVATTANITLSGLQAIDGVTVEDGNRVLVKDQTDAIENGIYDASASDWTRALDFDGSRDAVGGTEVNVIQGTANANTRWKVSGISASIDIATDEIEFEIAAGTSSTTQTFNANGTNTVDTTVAAILREKIRLYDYLTASQRTLAQAAFDDGAATAPDVAAALQQAVDDAAGNEVLLPRDMRMRLDSTVSRIPAAATFGGVFATGMKIIGPGSGLCKLESRVSSTHSAPYAFKCDTTTANLFQRDIVFQGFRLNGQHASAAGGSGIYCQRSYNVQLNDAYIEYFDTDGLYIPVITNDQDSSNEVRLDMSRFFACERWGMNIDPVDGHNDLSFLSLVNTTFTQCGTSGIKVITGVTQANPGVVTTSTAHGLTTGDKVYLFAIGGMTTLNVTMVTVTVISPTTFSIGVNTMGYPAYTTGGVMMPRVPASGSIRGRWQMAHFVDSYITESQNAGLLIAGGNGAAFQTLLSNFTIENTAGISLLVQGCYGLTGINLDLRSNSAAATSYAHVLFDASAYSIVSVDLQGTGIKANSGCTPHTAFDAIDFTNLTEVKITGSRFPEYDASGQTRYGNGLFGAQALTIKDSGRPWFEPAPYLKTTLTSTNMTVTLDVRRYQRHLIRATTVTTAALTLAGPTQTNMPGTALSGSWLDVLIQNASTAALNLSVGGTLDAVGAPASIAAASRVSVRFQYDSDTGWLRTTPWSTI